MRLRWSPAALLTGPAASLVAGVVDVAVALAQWAQTSMRDRIQGIQVLRRGR